MYFTCANFLQFTYLCKPDAGRVPKDYPIWHFKPCISDQLIVPDSEIMFPISTLRKYGNRRPGEKDHIGFAVKKMN